MIQREFTFTFEDQLNMSQGVGKGKTVEEIILLCIPGAVRVEKANLSDDRSGIDYWVTDVSGKRISVDVKVREIDWCKTHPKEDDLALEVWSVVGKRVGWTLDPNKKTDYVLWIWKDTMRWALFPFLMLRNVFSNNCEDWCKKYRTATQKSTWNDNPNSSQWKSQCVFVPSDLVWEDIKISSKGTLKS